MQSSDDILADVHRGIELQLLAEQRHRDLLLLYGDGKGGYQLPTTKKPKRRKKK